MASVLSRKLLEEVLDCAAKLPPFPDVINKVMPLIHRMAPISEIEAVIKYDQAITARVLALSQSPLYSRRQSVTSLRDAIVALGQTQLMQVITAACAFRYYQEGCKGYDLREGELWEHSVATAILSEKIAARLGLKNAFVLYTASLLHDIGKTILTFYVDSYFDQLLPLVRDKLVRFVDAERQLFGIDHQELGAQIAIRWKFPPEVTTAIKYHHYPTRARKHHETAAVVYIANRIVSSMGIGCGLDGFLQPNEDVVFQQLGFTTRMIDQLMVELLDALEKAKEFLSNGAQASS